MCFSNRCVVNTLKVTNAVTASCFCTGTSMLRKAEWRANYMFGESVCWLLEPINSRWRVNLVASCTADPGFSKVSAIRSTRQITANSTNFVPQNLNSETLQTWQVPKLLFFLQAPIGNSRFLTEMEIAALQGNTPVAEKKVLRAGNPKAVERNSVLSVSSGGQMSHWPWGK